jgi:hypothetical protein
VAACCRSILHGIFPPSCSGDLIISGADGISVQQRNMHRQWPPDKRRTLAHASQLLQRSDSVQDPGSRILTIDATTSEPRLPPLGPMTVTGRDSALAAC